MNTFKGRVAVVTGAASGIGRGLADRFAAEGMKVMLADVEQAPLDNAAREIAGTGADVLALRTDVSDAAAVETLAQTAYDRFGAVHVLCNNAGVGGGPSSWQEPLEDWQWVIGVNLWGVVNGIRSFVPRMLAGGDEGHIVNTASVAGLLAGGANASYTASKFAVVGLSETLHHELIAAGGKIKVSVLCPAMTNTNILDAGRNRPGGPPPQLAEGTPEKMFMDTLRDIFKTSGMAPSELAGIVLDAIVHERFYVLTHPEHNPQIEKRALAVTGGGPPPSLMG